MRARLGVIGNGNPEAQSSSTSGRIATGVVSNVPQVGQIIRAYSGVGLVSADRTDTVEPAGPDNIVGHHNVMNFNPVPIEVRRHIQAAAAARRKSEALQSPVACGDVDGARDATAKRGGALHPCHVVSRRAAHRSPLSINKAGSGVGPRRCKQNIPTIDRMQRREPGRTRRQSIVGIAAPRRGWSHIVRRSGACSGASNNLNGRGCRFGCILLAGCLHGNRGGRRNRARGGVESAR